MTSDDSRRSFLKKAIVTAGGLVAAPLLRGDGIPAAPAPAVGNARDYWVSVAERIAAPVLENLAARRLKQNMPVEEQKGANRTPVTHLEAFGRLLSGIAPWLEQDKPAKWVKLAQASLDAATDPESPDFMNFTKQHQPLVDAAFLALALLRAPTVLWAQLDARVKKNIVAALKSSRVIIPGENNWLLFAATVEAFLFRAGETVDRARVGRALSKHMEWYKGDGMYGDGSRFHYDYYNSFVIQPMLVEVSTVFADDGEWGKVRADVMKRAQRYAAIQERQISPEGSYPVIGRSMAYRFGAFHALAQIALMKKLPAGVLPAQVRCALTAAIRRQMAAKDNFDDAGWLRLGFCGHQPGLADSYVSTGSLYLCVNALLPLGLPADDPFWHAPDALWTQAKAWSGVDLPGDHAIA